MTSYCSRSTARSDGGLDPFIVSRPCPRSATPAALKICRARQHRQQRQHSLCRDRASRHTAAALSAHLRNEGRQECVGIQNFIRVREGFARAKNALLLAFIAALVITSCSPAQASQVGSETSNAFQGRTRVPGLNQIRNTVYLGATYKFLQWARLLELYTAPGCSPGPHHQAIWQRHLCHPIWHRVLRNWARHHSLPAR